MTQRIVRLRRRISYHLIGKLLSQCHGRSTVVERPDSVPREPPTHTRFSRRLRTTTKMVSVSSVKVLSSSPLPSLWCVINDHRLIFFKTKDKYIRIRDHVIVIIKVFFLPMMVPCVTIKMT